MSPCQKKLFFSFPDSNDVLSLPLNAWKNRNAKDLSGSKPLPNLVNRHESQQFFMRQIQPKVHLMVPVDKN